MNRTISQGIFLVSIKKVFMAYLLIVIDGIYWFWYETSSYYALLNVISSWWINKHNCDLRWPYLRLNAVRKSFNINGSHNASIYHGSPTKFERLPFVVNFGKTYIQWKMYASDSDTINSLEHDHHMRWNIDCGRRRTDCVNCEPFIKE